MKKILITLLIACCFVGCSNKDDNLMDCKVFWQIYHTPKYLEESEIEHAYSTTFFGFFQRINNNTVIARQTTQQDVRSLTLKLASMADEKLEGTLDPALDYQVEVRVYINYGGKYVEEVWNKSY